MKRMILFLLIIALLMSGCSQGTEMKKPLKFYYPVKNVDYSIGSSYLQPEVRDGALIGDYLVDILNTYLRGPVDNQTYSMPFQYNTRVQSLSVKDGILDITLTRGFATYTGLPLTIACACITMTALELTNVETVRIRAHNTSLDGAEYIEMNAATILLLDIGTAPEE